MKRKLKRKHIKDCNTPIPLEKESAIGSLTLSDEESNYTMKEPKMSGKIFSRTKSHCTCLPLKKQNLK